MLRISKSSLQKFINAFLLTTFACFAWNTAIDYVHAVAPIPATDSQKVYRYENKLVGRKVFSVEFTWDTPTAREDGSPLTISEIGSYVIEYGAYTVNAGNGNTFVLHNLFSGTYSFRIATIDSDGQQGNFSEPIILTL